MTLKQKPINFKEHLFAFEVVFDLSFGSGSENAVCNRTHYNGRLIPS